MEENGKIELSMTDRQQHNQRVVRAALLSMIRTGEAKPKTFNINDGKGKATTVVIYHVPPIQ